MPELSEEQKRIVSKRKIAKVKDYKKIFSSVEGKRVLLDLMNTCYVMHGSFSPDPHRTAYNEGQRATVWKILHHLNMDERQLLKFIEERESYEYSSAID